MARLVIQKCSGKNCESKYQNKKYGEGYRVMNVKSDKADATQCRCTICGTEQSIKK